MFQFFENVFRKSWTLLQKDKFCTDNESEKQNEQQ